MTKPEIIEKCRKILYSSGTNYPLKSEDFNFLINLFPLHKEWNKKRNGHSVKAIVVRRHPQYNNLCFALVLDDDTKVDISFTECVNRIGLKEDVKNACRLFINDLPIDDKKFNKTIKDWIATFENQYLTVGIYLEGYGDGSHFSDNNIGQNFRNYYINN